MEPLVDNAPAGGPAFGPFRLQRLLSRDADNAWWLAHDAQASREVVLKVLERAPLAGMDEPLWRRAAAPVTALSHPNLLPLIEARFEQRQPVLVWEALRGITLAQWIAEHDAMPARQAVLLVIGVLDGLAHAHAHGVVHGQLRPQAVLLDMAGRPRLADFAIPPQAPDTRSLATASGLYLAPEVARGQLPDVRSDVFGAGLLLYELLVGRPAIQDANPQRAIAQLLESSIELPARLPNIEHDEALLRRVLARALAQDPSQRPASAGELRAALQEWLTPALLDGSGDSRAARTVQQLMDRISHHPDLPVQTEVVRRVRRLVAAERVNLDEVARAILEDVALTQKLLRMMNAAYFSSVGGGSITTVSRCVALMGFVAIRDLAGTLPTLEDMPDERRAQALREEYERCRQAGRFAARLCPTQADEEECFVAAVMQNLGRTLVQFYMPEQAAEIRQLALSQGGTEDAAVLSVLGVAFEDLGVGVARSWGLPESLVRCMRRPSVEGVVRRPERKGDWFRLLGALGNELADTQRGVLRSGATASTHAIEQYARALGMTSQEVWETVDLKAPVPRKPQARPSASAARPGNAPAQPVHPLSKAIFRVRAAIGTEGIDPALHAAGQAVYDGLQCQHAAVLVRLPGTSRFVTQHAWGPREQALRRHFEFVLEDESNAFAALCRRGVDSLIRDAHAATLAARLPAWYHEQVRASSFMLLPMRVGDKPVGLLYADKAQVDGFRLSDRELSLLRNLRDEAQKAFVPTVSWVAASSPLRA